MGVGIPLQFSGISGKWMWCLVWFIGVSFVVCTLFLALFFVQNRYAWSKMLPSSSCGWFARLCVRYVPLLVFGLGGCRVVT